MDAFGVDGTAVIAATNEYLNGIAASDRAKATALAGFINEDPMMVCSLGLEPQGVTMPWRWLQGDGVAYIDLGVNSTATTKATFQFMRAADENTNGLCFGGDWGIDFSLRPHPNGNFRWYFTGGNSIQSINTTPGVGYEVIAENGKLTVDGSAQTGSLSSSYGRALYLFGPAGYRTKSAFGRYDLEVDANTRLELVPYKLKENGVVVNCMLDLQKVGVAGARLFYKNANSSGSFTIPDISYTPTP